MRQLIGDNVQYRIIPGGYLHGETEVPGDKSISHRAAILGAISEGETRINGFLQAQDCLHTLQALIDLGVKIENDGSEVMVEGVGLHGLQAPKAPLNFGNAGTGIRLFSGLLAGQPFPSTLVGDASLHKRPMQRIIEPLLRMSARISGIESNKNIYPPLQIQPADKLQGISYTLPIPSAQIKSCLLLAGLYAASPTSIEEPEPSRDHTERMLVQFGADLTSAASRITLNPARLQARPLRGCTVMVPGDMSSAAFFIAGAAVDPNAHIIVRNVGVNPRRTGMIRILQKMGADIRMEIVQETPEPIAHIEVIGKALQGAVIPQAWVVDAIDEFPILFVAASLAAGRTIFSGLQELRVKESDRIHAMRVGLESIGVSVTEQPDGLMIEGSQIVGGVVNSFGDHRVAMAFSIAGMYAAQPIIVQDCAPIETSFPQFRQIAKALGIQIEESVLA